MRDKIKVSKKQHSNSKEENEKPQKREVLKALEILAGYSGPLPPPQILSGYEECVPGSAKLIINSFIEESKHRRNLEEKLVNSQIRSDLLGMIFGLIIGIGGLTAATLCAFLGQPWPASIIGGGTLVGLVSVFVVGQKIKRKRDETSDRA